MEWPGPWQAFACGHDLSLPVSPAVCLPITPGAAEEAGSLIADTFTPGGLLPGKCPWPVLMSGALPLTIIQHLGPRHCQEHLEPQALELLAGRKGPGLQTKGDETCEGRSLRFLCF